MTTQVSNQVRYVLLSEFDMIRLESFADSGPEPTPLGTSSECHPLKTDDTVIVSPSKSLGNVPKSPLTPPKSPHVDVPAAVASNRPDRHGLMTLESFCEPPEDSATLGNAASRENSASRSRTPNKDVSANSETAGASTSPKSLNALISTGNNTGANTRVNPGRRRTFDDEPQFPTRRRSLRNKVLSSIIDNTFGVAIAHVVNDTTPSEGKYLSDSPKSPPAKPPRVTDRRSSFGDAQPQKRRGSIRDKIIGHIIQAAVMGVGHSEDAEKKGTTEGGR